MKPKAEHIAHIKGFTLLELILVMIILCTVLGMASPSLRGFFSSRQLNDIAEQIIVLTRYAKTQAIYESKYYRVNFDLNRRLFWISVLNESEFTRQQKQLANTYHIPADLKMAFENLSMESGFYYIEFNPEGYATPCSIIMQDNKNNTIQIACLSPAENFEMAEILDGKIYY